MIVDVIFEKLIKQPIGAEYIKSDLHVHFSPPNTDDSSIESYCKNLFDVLKAYEIKLIALTVHRQCDLELLFKAIELIEDLSKKESYDLFIFPSIEIRDSSNTHFAIIFNKDLNITEIGNFMGQIGRNRDQENLDDFEKSDVIKKSLSGDQIELGKVFSDYKVIGLFPHPLINDGIAKKITGESLQNYVVNPLTYLWNLGIPKNDIDMSLKNNDCPVIFTNTPSKYEDNQQLKKLARIKVSDGHNPEKLNAIYKFCPQCHLYEYCNIGFTYLKLSNKGITGLKQIEYDHKTRVKFNTNIIKSNDYLEGIYIKSNFFKEEYFRFNPELNVLVGGRGTGKSLLIDLIRFACHSRPNDKEYMNIFSSKLIKQLGNEGKVIVFYKDKEKNIWAVENVLLIEENAESIDWNENVSTKIYKKYSNNPFLEEDLDIINLKIKIKALSQTEIPRVHKKVDSLLEIIDSYVTEFSEKVERFTLIQEVDRIKVDILTDYENYRELIKKSEDIKEYKQKLEEDIKYLAEVQDLNVEDYQKLISINSLFNDEKFNILKYFEDLLKTSEFNIEGYTFLDIPSEFKSNFDIIANIYLKIINQVNSFKSTINDLIINAKLEFENKFEDFLKNWNSFYNPKFEKFKEILNKHDKGFIEKIQQRVIKLEKKIKDHEKNLENLPILTEKLATMESNLIDIGKNIFRKTLEINLKRNEFAKNIEEKLKQNDINAKIKFHKNKNVKESNYYKLLYKLYKTKSDILKRIHNKYYPHELVEKIFNDKIITISKNFPKQQRKIFDKLNDLIESNDRVKIFKPLLFDLLKFHIDNQPLISYKRESWKRFQPLNKLSIGERCAILLYIMLLVEDLPFLVDQADSELDQESTERFSQYLLEIKETRQIIIATHNPNIPTLGDVDLLIHLDTEPFGDREIGKVLNRGGFENSIDAILKLEGGREAIKRRFKKYNEKLFD